MKPLFTFLLICLTSLSFAQEMPYDLVVSQEVYTELEGDTVVDMTQWEGEPYTINFPYYYNFMTHALVSLDQIGSGTMFMASSFNGVERNLLIPYGLDLTDASLITQSDSSVVSYRTEISPEDTAFVVQFKNMGFISGAEAGDTISRVNFQMRFYRNTNKFQIMFGPSNISNQSAVFGDFSGPPVLFSSEVTEEIDPDVEDNFNYTYATLYYLSGDPQNPELMETNSAWFHWNQDTLYLQSGGIEYLNGQPTSGTTYTFEPNISTGIAENAMADFEVYPSPTEHFLNIRFPENYRKEVVIYNAVGQKVMAFYADRKENFKRIDVHNLVPGIYLVHAGNETRKFIKK